MRNETTPVGDQAQLRLIDAAQGILYRVMCNCDALAIVRVRRIDEDPNQPQYSVWLIRNDRTQTAVLTELRCEEIIVEEFRPGEGVNLQF